MKGYRTLAFNLLALAAVWLGIPEDALRAWASEIMTGIAAVNMALRFVTKSPVAGGSADAAIAALKNWIDRGGFVGALLAAAIAAMGTLSACAGAVIGNPQGYAGITDAHVEVGTAAKDETPYIKDVRFRDGKEKQNIEITVKFDGDKPTVTYKAEGVKAFDGQKIRTAIEQAVSADVRAAAPGIVESVLAGVKAALGVP